LKWEISNCEIRRFEIWFEISGANRGRLIPLASKSYNVILTGVEGFIGLEENV